MKNSFKYLFIAFTAGLVAVACEPTPAEGPSEPVVKSAGIDIKVASVGEDNCTVVLTPQGPANYYSYMLVEGTEAEHLDSLAFYNGELASKVENVDNGMIKYSAEEPSSTLEFKGLTPGASYIVYAVSSSTTGVPSSVYSATFTTNDKQAPTLEEVFVYPKMNAVVAAFSEPVQVVDGKNFTLKLMKAYTFDGLETVSTKIMKSSDLKLMGSYVLFVTDQELLPGVVASVTFASESVKDLSGNLWKPAKNTFMAQNDNELVGLKEVTPDFFSYTDEEGNKMTFALFDFEAEGSMGFYIDKDKNVFPYGEEQLDADVTYYQEKDGRDFVKSGKLNNFSELSYGPNASGEYYVPYLLLPDALPGDSITVSIPEKYLGDYYGNYNKAFKFSVRIPQEVTPAPASFLPKARRR